MRIVLELVHIRRVLANQLHGEGECPRGVDVVVAKYLVVYRARLQHVGLKRDPDRNGLFVMHEAVLLRIERLNACAAL
jgi:hypothetical protein